MGNSITSKYFSHHLDFVTSKIPKNSFSIFHLNIASPEGHIDDLKCLLSILNHDFDVIGITESKIRNSESISNLRIEGNNFEFTPTESFFGGTSLYIKNPITVIKEMNIANL